MMKLYCKQWKYIVGKQVSVKYRKCLKVDVTLTVEIYFYKKLKLEFKSKIKKIIENNIKLW